MFHPAPALALTASIAAVWAAVNCVSQRRERERPSLALSGLGFVSSLNILAYLAGFTIGVLVALTSLLAALVLVALVQPYRTELLASSAMSLLLALITRGVPFAREILAVLLALMVVRAGWKVRGYLKNKDTPAPIVIMIGYLFGLALVAPSGAAPFFSAVVVAMGGLLFIRIGQYRWQGALMGLGGLLWLLDTTLFLHR